jgi:hypothetical protein
MRVRDFAPHLAGRMLPGLFSCMPFAKKPRFEGDPWPTFPHTPTWYWMHTTECGSPNHLGSFKSLPVDRQPWPDDIDWIYMPAPRRAERTPSPQAAGIDRPSVGSMGARHPADAGPQRELFA